MPRWRRAWRRWCPDATPDAFTYDSGLAAVYCESGADGQLDALGYAAGTSRPDSGVVSSTGIAPGTMPSDFDNGGGGTLTNY
jgi:hypothetical protein